MMRFLVNLLVHSPLYPHWLEVKKKNEADQLMLRALRGSVLEVGAGDGFHKKEFLQTHPRIRKYLATDYSEWDGEFSKIDRLIQKAGPLGGVIQSILGYHERAELDAVCDAMDLPFPENTFDYHLSFETLEHIRNPYRYFSEASRVLKKGGHIYLSVPFLYRMHGGEPEHRWDYHRYAFGFFHEIAQQNNLRIVRLYSNTGVGTTVAALSNQFVIRRLFESPWPQKVFWILIAPLVFMTTNTLGFFVDLEPDIRFSTRFHILLQKK